MDQELMDANEKKLIEDKIMNILASPNFSYDNDHALGPNLCVSYVLSIRFFFTWKLTKLRNSWMRKITELD